MTWLGYLLIAMLTLKAFIAVRLIGKPIPAYTPASASWSVIANAAIIVAIVTVGTNR